MLVLLCGTLFAQKSDLKMADDSFSQKDYASAELIYKEHSDNLTPRQTANLGFCFFVKKEYSDAIKFFKEASEKGDAHGYNRGIGGMEKNLELAVKYYEDAANLGDDFATFNLGYMHYSGSGIEVNYEKAHEYYTAAAELGNSRAMNNLGDMYETGTYVEIKPLSGMRKQRIKIMPLHKSVLE